MGLKKIPPGRGGGNPPRVGDQGVKGCIWEKSIVRITSQKSNIDTKNDGFLKCISGFIFWRHFGGPPAVRFRGNVYSEATLYYLACELPLLITVAFSGGNDYYFLEHLNPYSSRANATVTGRRFPHCQKAVIYIQPK